MPFTRLASLALCAVVTIVDVPAMAQSNAPIVIKLSHVVAPGTAKGKAAVKFKEFAEARTKGRVKVDVYDSSSLYKDKEEMEALQLGSVQMLIPAVAKFGPIGIAEFDVFDLPYMFPDLDALHRVTQGPIGKDLLKKLESRGIAGLAFWDNAFTMYTANRPIPKPEAMKGLKLRSYSKVIDAQIRALSAVPQTMAFSELYQALDTGVIDGQDTVPINVYTQKLYEVQKFGVLSNHRHPVYAVIANKKFWDGLPPDIRAQLDAALVDATKFNNEISQKENAEALTAMKASARIQIHQPSPAELDAWKKALMPVYAQMESRAGKDMITSVRKEAGSSTGAGK